MRAVSLGFALMGLIAWAGCVADDPKAAAATTPLAPAPDPVTDAETGSIVGTITDDEQSPIAGVEVVVVDGPSTKSDDTGSYTLNGVAPGERTVFTSKLGFEEGARKVTVVAGEIAKLEFVLKAVVIIEVYHETFTKVGIVTGQWTVNYVVNVVNDTNLDNVFCGPCIWRVEFPPNIKDAVTDVVFKPSLTAPLLNEFILVAYNKAGQGDVYDGIMSAAFTPNGDTHHWTEGQVKNLKDVPQARLQMSGGDVEDVGIAFQQRVELWQTWGFGDVLPEDFTVLAPA